LVPCCYLFSRTGFFSLFPPSWKLLPDWSSSFCSSQYTPSCLGFFFVFPLVCEKLPPSRRTHRLSCRPLLYFLMGVATGVLPVYIANGPCLAVVWCFRSSTFWEAFSCCPRALSVFSSAVLRRKSTPIRFHRPFSR